MMHLPRWLVVAFTGLAFRLALNPRASVRMQRWILALACRPILAPRRTRIRHLTLGGRPAERTTLGPHDERRAVLYLHGGAYVLGSARIYRSLAAHLARSSGAVVYNLDYRLAPEHPFPAALDDAVAAFRELVDAHGYRPDQIAIAGDSAGGGLTVAAARVLTDAGQRPAALALLSPWTDPSDHDLPERDFVVNREWGSASAAMYRGNAPEDAPGYAPLRGRLDGLPRILVHYCEDEILRAQILRFVELARTAGVEVQAEGQPRLWHSGHLLAGMLREATLATESVGRFIQSVDATTDARALRSSQGAGLSGR